MTDESRRRLFAAPPEEFVAVRDAQARELKAAGKSEEAEAIKKRRKPPVALWIANQLARLTPEDVAALIDATARLRHGQSAAAHGASGDELREAMRAQREALARLGDAAGRAALEADTKLTPELQRRVQTTVQAAAASEPEALREGVLERELQPSGFEGLLSAAPAAAPAETKPARHAGHAAAARANETAADRARTDGRARQEAAAAERARKKEEAAAREREKERERALRKAEHEAQALDARARKLEELASRREEEAARARQDADAARREADAARREADEAAARALKLRS